MQHFPLFVAYFLYTCPHIEWTAKRRSIEFAHRFKGNSIRAGCIRYTCKPDVQCRAKSSPLCVGLRVALWCERCWTVPTSSANRNVKQFWIFFMSSLKAIFNFSFFIFTEMCQVMTIFLALQYSRVSHARFMEMRIRFQNGRSQISKAWNSATHTTWLKGHLSINFVRMRVKYLSLAQAY